MNNFHFYLSPHPASPRQGRGACRELILRPILRGSTTKCWRTPGHRSAIDGAFDNAPGQADDTDIRECSGAIGLSGTRQ